ncbi:putative RTA1 domain protein [Mariannaea sp. PMI_226]|nr:putative RTA1 domain protein [Mariannaea sp. PMI_226]
MVSPNNCTQVSAACPVELTTYGYYPALGPNAALLTVFAILLCAQITLTILTKIYSYSIVVAVGCFVEMLGYVGRVMMHSNPWNRLGMRMQIVCLIIAPSFAAAGIYLTLKHTILHYGKQYSRLRPKLYTWIFIGCDIGSILLQAGGGGIAASANSPDKVDIGNNVIIAGIAFQVVTMAICGALAVDFLLRRFRRKQQPKDNNNFCMHSSRATTMFQVAVCFAYVAILIRSIYRIPEMVGGWGNPMMRNEKDFLLLDGLMIALASIALTVFHPGFFFPAMKTGAGHTANDSSSSDGLTSIRLDSSPRNENK